MLRVVKLTALLLFAASALLACQILRNSGDDSLGPKPAGALRVASYNVHYILLGKATGAWSVADWEARRGPLDTAFKALSADAVAFQEMESFRSGSDGGVNLARDWLLANNPGYAVAASGEWRDFPPTQPILYRTDRLDEVDAGWFFFSETPDTIYSRTFDGSFPAFASWAAFRDLRNGGRITLVNVHTDYASGDNRRRSAELIAARMGPRIAAGERVVLAGDLNARHGSEVHGILEEAGFDFLPVTGATYHFNRGINLFGAIDHIALSPGLAPAGPPVVLRRRFGDRWPTDHYPVVADIAPAD